MFCMVLQVGCGIHVYCQWVALYAYRKWIALVCILQVPGTTLLGRSIHVTHVSTLAVGLPCCKEES